MSNADGQRGTGSVTDLRRQIERLKAVCCEHIGLREQIEALEAIALRLDQNVEVLVRALRQSDRSGTPDKG